MKTGYVVAAEVDLISDDYLGTEAEKENRHAVLLAGERKESLLPCDAYRNLPTSATSEPISHQRSTGYRPLWNNA